MKVTLSYLYFPCYAYSVASFESQVEIETLNYIYLVFSLHVINENVDSVFIEIYRIREVFQETLISFNNKQIRHWKGDTIRFCAMGNIDRIFCLNQSELLIYILFFDFFA